jgi:hypothetical protein
MSDSRASNLGIKEEGRSLDEFTNKETKDSEHTNTAMGDLSLAVTSHGWGACLGSKVQRIEESERTSDSRKILGSVENILDNRGKDLGLWHFGGNFRDFRVESEGSSLHGRRSEGSSRAEEKDEGGAREFHGVVFVCLLVVMSFGTQF